jgi:hypothetical protein
MSVYDVLFLVFAILSGSLAVWKMSLDKTPLEAKLLSFGLTSITCLFSLEISFGYRVLMPLWAFVAILNLFDFVVALGEFE